MPTLTLVYKAVLDPHKGKCIFCQSAKAVLEIETSQQYGDMPIHCCAGQVCIDRATDMKVEMDAEFNKGRYANDITKPLIER